WQIPEPDVKGLSVSPDGQLLATATLNQAVDLHPNFPWAIAPGAALPERPTPTIKIWNVANRQLQHVLPGQISVAFSPDGQRLAGAHDCCVKLWDVVTGKELRTFSGLTEPALKVQFAVGGRQVVGFSARQARVWDTATGRTIAAVDGLKGPALITPDGERIVGIHGGLIKWW